MRIRIDVSVFSTPTTALGNATGEMDVAKVPEAQDPFPWPNHWVAARPAYFSREHSQVSGVSEVNGQALVVLDGIVCNSLEEARDCAAFLETVGGLFFDAYDHRRTGA